MWSAVAAPRVQEDQVLSGLEKNPYLLVNVTAGDMPASPDVLALGKRSTQALMRCLADNQDRALRADCAGMLGTLGDPASVPTLQIALEDWEANVRFEVIRALGQIADPRSVPSLVAAWSRSDEDTRNRAAILRALGSSGEPAATQFLQKVLAEKEPKTDLRPLAFGELWRNKHRLSKAVLLDQIERALWTDNSRLVLAATLRAAEYPSRQLTKALLSHLDDGNANLRNKTIRALGLVGDRSAEKRLLAMLPEARDARLLNNIAFALERIDRPAFFAQIKKLIAHKQAVIRLNAAFVVGDVRRPEGTPLIDVALHDASDGVRLEAIEAAAKLPSPASLLATGLRDTSERIRLVAVRAAAEVAEPQPLLATAMKDFDEAVRVEAVHGARSLKSPGPFLSAAMSDKEASVRQAVVQVANALEHPPAALLVGALSDDNGTVQSTAIDAVAHHKIAAGLPALDSIASTLSPGSTQPKSPHWEEAIYAMHTITPGGRADLLYDRLFASDSQTRSHRAALVLGQAPDIRVHDYLVECLLAEHCQVGEVEPSLRKERDPRVLRQLQLSWVRRRHEFGPLMVVLKPPGTEQLALADLELQPGTDWPALKRSLEMLIALSATDARPLVEARVRKANLWQRVDLQVALDRLGDPAAKVRLAKVLDQLPVEWLPRAVSVLASIPEPACRGALAAELGPRETQPEYHLALAAAAVRLDWRAGELPKRLIDGLVSSKTRERELARRYLRAAKVEDLTRAATGESRLEAKQELQRLING